MNAHTHTNTNTSSTLVSYLALLWMKEKLKKEKNLLHIGVVLGTALDKRYPPFISQSLPLLGRHLSLRVRASIRAHTTRVMAPYGTLYGNHKLNGSNYRTVYVCMRV